MKDTSGHISGYVRADGADVFCRVSLGFSAELAVVYLDGSQKEYVLSECTDEQHISCDGKNMSGCYVFKDDELLLISDKTMHSAFENRTLSRRRRSTAHRECTPEPEKETQAPFANETGIRENRKQRFPQRRWPQPPCWDMAVYRRGRWQEPEEE